MSHKTLASALFLCGLAIFLSPMYMSPPSSNDVVWESFQSEMRGYNKVFSDAADRVKSGELETDKQLYDFINPKTGDVRREARMILDSYFQNKLPRVGDKLSGEAYLFISDIASQFLKASSR